MRSFTITSRDIQRCPIRSMLVEHYRADGTCHCKPSKIAHEGDRPSDACPGCQNEGAMYHETDIPNRKRTRP